MKHLGRWRKVPNERDPRWFSLGIVARALGLELWMAAPTDANWQPMPIRTYGDWRVSLCKLLQVDPLERGNVCKTLDRIQHAGLLTVGDGYVIVHLAPQPIDVPEPDRPRSAPTPPKVRRDSDQGPLDVRFGSSTRNDSTPVSQREEREEKRETDRDARARGEVAPSLVKIAENRNAESLAFDLRVGFIKRYQLAERSHPNEGQLSKAIAVLVEWVRVSAPLQRVSESELGVKVLDAFFASTKARENRFRPGFLAFDPGEWLAPPAPASSPRATRPTREQLEEAQLECTQAARGLQAIENTDCFTKERKDYPQLVEHARQHYQRARKALDQLLARQKQAVAS